ncbi:MAG: hypothetical protein Q8O38_10140 [Sulfurimicrobium sp.]|nr:hypothetical protein [Sulfurimicrobium sp.]
MSDIVIYEAENGAVSVKLAQETVWLTQRQLAELLDTTPENILMYLRNIYRDEELDAEATAKDFLVVRTEGNPSSTIPGWPRSPCWLPNPIPCRKRC